MTIAEENAALKADLETAQAAQLAATTEVSALKETQAETAEAMARLAERNKELATALEEADADKVDAEALAGEKAAEIVAQQGAEPVVEETEAHAQEKDLPALWEEYGAIENLKEKTLFYRNEIKPKL